MKIALSTFLISSSLLIADECGMQGPCCIEIPCCLSSYFMIGANYSRVNFKPDGEPSFNGNLGGVHARYEYRPLDAFYAAAELYWRQGSMNGPAGKRTLVDIDTAEKFGYTWGFHCFNLSLYTGFGFRYLGHHLHPSTEPATTFNGSFFPPFISEETSLKFNYYEFYVPVGFISEYIFTSWFALGLNFKWMPQIFPTAQIRPLGGAFWSLSHKLGNFLVELPFIFNLTSCSNWKLVVNPFYQRWQDGHSTAETSSGTSLGLPSNTYNFYGADLNLIYAF